MKFLLCITFLSVICSSAFSQEPENNKHYGFNDYLLILPSINWDKDKTEWQSIINYRLNFDWYPSEKLTSSIQLRNQIFGGDILKVENQESGFKSESYFLPLTYIQKFNDSYFLSSIDRLRLQSTTNKLEIKIGRQRINWGQTFV